MSAVSVRPLQDGKKHLQPERNASRPHETQLVMPGEDATAFENLRRGLHATYKPANEGERILVDQIAANAWRLMRAQRVETASSTC